MLLRSMFSSYQADPTTPWDLRNTYMYFSTGLYLINREKMRPIINSVVHIDPIYPTIIQYTLIAARPGRGKYIPHECTATPTQPTLLPCIPIMDIVADRYIYALTTTYMSRLPIAYARPGFKTTV